MIVTTYLNIIYNPLFNSYSRVEKHKNVVKKVMAFQ